MHQQHLPGIEPDPQPKTRNRGPAKTEEVDTGQTVIECTDDFELGVHPGNDTAFWAEKCRNTLDAWKALGFAPMLISRWCRMAGQFATSILVKLEDAGIVEIESRRLHGERLVERKKEEEDEQG